MPVDTSQLKQRIKEILDAKAELKKLTAKPYDELTMNEKYAIRYQVIVLAEALGGTCYHISLEDLGQEPISYSDCFAILDEEGICSHCAHDLSTIVRLRNLLTHQYWTIDDQRVYGAIQNDFKSVDKFLQSVVDKYAIDL